VPIVLKSGSLNLLEPSGPVQACNGIALPFLHLLGARLSCSLNMSVLCYNNTVCHILCTWPGDAVVGPP